MFQIAKGPYDTLDFHFLKFRWGEELELGKGDFFSGRQLIGGEIRPNE